MPSTRNHKEKKQMTPLIPRNLAESFAKTLHHQGYAEAVRIFCSDVPVPEKEESKSKLFADYIRPFVSASLVGKRYELKINDGFKYRNADNDYGFTFSPAREVKVQLPGTFHTNHNTPKSLCYDNVAGEALIDLLSTEEEKEAFRKARKDRRDEMKKQTP